MKTKGEIEAAIADGMIRFEQEFMGRGPKEIHVYLIHDLVLIRLQAFLTAPEHHLIKTLEAEKGRDMVKQLRRQLIEAARPTLEAMLVEITGVKVVSMHHDLSTTTGEKVVAFTFASPPVYRESKSG